jgi:DNA polymerase elongation subunit (family B)
MSSKLHGKIFEYSQIKNIPNRNGFLKKDIYNTIQELITKNKELLFMPNALHEMNIQEKKYEKGMYKLILFGAFQDGRKATVVLSGILPYFEVIIPELDNKDDINKDDIDKDSHYSEYAFKLFERLKNFKYACPEKFEIIKGKTFKGYQKRKKTFARFYFTKLQNRKEAIKYVDEQGYETSTNDKSCYYRIVCRDYKTSFSSWVNIKNYKIKTYPSIRGVVFDVNINNYNECTEDITTNIKLSKDNIMTCCWDIETYSPDGQVPLPDNLEHKLFMIGITFQWHHSNEQIFRVCLVDHPCNSRPNYLTVVCGSEKKIIKAFGKIVHKLNPDIFLGFNDTDYDWPWLIKRAKHYKGVLAFLGENFDNTIHWADYDDDNVFKYNFKKERIKLESDMYVDGYFLSYPGYICIDVRTVFRQLYPTAEKSNLNFYLSLNKLGGKKDMPYKEIFKTHGEMTEIMKKIESQNINIKCEIAKRNIINGICTKFDMPTNTSKCMLGYSCSLSDDDFAKYIELKDKMAEIADYCIIDSQRCHELMKIRSVIMDRREISKLSYTSVFDSFYRANGMKVRNLVIARGQPFGIRFSNVTNNSVIEEGQYPGAYVYPPKKGLITSKLSISERIASGFMEKYKEWETIGDDEKNYYYDLIDIYGCCYNESYENIINQIPEKSPKLRQCFIDFLKELMGRPITGLDFSSLYPSLIMTYNYSPEYIIVNKKEAQLAYDDGHDLHKIKFIYNGKIVRGWSVKHENKLDPNSKDCKFGIYPMVLKELFDSRNLMKKELHKWESKKENLESLSKKLFDNHDTQEIYENVCFNFNYINSKQKALKVFMNTFYGETGNKISSFFVLQLAGAITTAGQKNIKMVQKYVENQDCKVYYGDSVTGDSPLILRNKNTKKVLIKTIDDISNKWIDYDQFKKGEHNRIEKQQTECDFEIWTEGSWHNIRRVIRHKTNKKIYRVNTHTGVVDVTEDHSLMTSKRIKIKPSDLIIGSELMHSFPQKFPEFTLTNSTDVVQIHCYVCNKDMPYYDFYRKRINNSYHDQCKKCNWSADILNNESTLTTEYFSQYEYIHCIQQVTKEEAYVWGFFMRSGSCNYYRCANNVKRSWFINNKNSAYLNQLLEYLELCEPNLKFKLFDALNSSGVYKLIPQGCIKLIVEKYRKIFYDKRQYKIIPDQILNGSKEIRQSFFDGYCTGNGFKNIEKNIENQSFQCTGKITSQCIFYLIKSLGYKYVSINIMESKPDAYWIIIGLRNFRKNPNSVKKILDLPDVNHETFVYDIETSAGSFNCGVGCLNILNTDSLYLSMPEKCFDILDKKYYSGKIDKLYYWNEMINITFDRIKPLNNSVNQLLKEDNGTDFLKMAFEESLYPVAFLAKKKYYGIPHISIPNFQPKELFIKGLGVVKRGVSGMLKKVCMEIMWDSVKLSNVNTLMELVLNRVNHIYDTKWNFKDFVMTDMFKPNKQNIKVQTFAKRMFAAGIKVKPYERFNYVIVKTNPFNYDNRGRKVSKLIGEKMEYADRAEELGMEIDLDYYMQGSVNGQLSRLITYHELFHVDPVDDTAESMKTADDKTYNNACKFIEKYCQKYYTTYNSKGKIYQSIFRMSNKVVTTKIKEYCTDDIASLLSSNIDLEEIGKHLNYKAEQDAIKKVKGYGKQYIDDYVNQSIKKILDTELEKNEILEKMKSDTYIKDESSEVNDVVDNNDTYVIKTPEEEEKILKERIKRIKSKKMIELQNIYFARKHNNLYNIRQQSFVDRQDILNRQVIDNLDSISSVLMKHNDIVYNLSDDIKKFLDIDNKFNNANVDVPTFNELENVDKIDYDKLNNIVESKLMKYLSNDNILHALNKLRFIFINMKSNYSFIHKTYSIIDYLKICRNKKTNTTTKQIFLNTDLNIDMDTKIKNDVDSILLENKKNNNLEKIF